MFDQITDKNNQQRDGKVDDEIQRDRQKNRYDINNHHSDGIKQQKLTDGFQWISPFDGIHITSVRML